MAKYLSDQFDNYIVHIGDEFDKLDGTYDQEKKFSALLNEDTRKALGGLFSKYPAFKKEFIKHLRPIVSATKREAIKAMPMNTLTGQKDSAFKSYSKKRQAENDKYFEKNKKLKYHYTNDKRSIRKRTNIYLNTPTKGSYKGAITIRWRVSKFNYNFLKYGYDRFGEQHEEMIAPWTKDYERSYNWLADKLQGRTLYNGLPSWGSVNRIAGEIAQNLALKMFTPGTRATGKQLAAKARGDQMIIDISTVFDLDLANHDYIGGEY